ncbi:hypothetical protein ABPG72_010699 [Tetrahymena utriculariae]
MASQLEQFGLIQRSISFETQNYLNLIELYINNDLSDKQTIKKLTPYKLVEPILIKEDALFQINQDKTIKKKTQAFVNRFTKQQNLNRKQYSVFNIQNNQFALVFNSNSSYQKINNQSVSSDSKNDQEVNKQSNRVENYFKQEFKKIILTLNESLKQNLNQIQECITDQINSQQNIQKQSISSLNSRLNELEIKNLNESCFKQKSVIEQIVIESNYSDEFNQKNVQAYKDNSLSQSENDKTSDENFNNIDQNIKFSQNFKEFMNEICYNIKYYHYHLIEQIQSSEYEDIFLGYQDQDSNKSQTLVFKLFYNLRLQNLQNQEIQFQKMNNIIKNIETKLQSGLRRQIQKAIESSLCQVMLRFQQ